MNFGCGDDTSFGPAVRGCRGNFDFTIRFEQLVLAIIPPAVFIAAVVPRAVSLRRKPLLVEGTVLLVSKVVAIAVLAALQIGLLVLSTRPGRFQTLLTASSALALASSACMLLVSWLEHVRSPRPSILLAGYLFLSILFDVAMLRTFWLARSPMPSSSEEAFCRLFSSALAVKTVVMGLESVHKTRHIRSSAAWWQSVAHSPEETSGLFGIGAYSWLGSLFLKGFRNVMVLDDLFALDPAMSSKSLERKLVAATASTSTPGRTYDFGRKKHGLFRALVRALAVDLLLPVAPRLALAGFLFGQPFLINAVLAYLDDPTAPKNHSYGLIGATFLIYFGISVSSAVHYYYQERAMYMVRGALAAAVYRKTTELPLSEVPADDNNKNDENDKNDTNSKNQKAASASLTLMSTDVERIRTGFLNIHEYWANLMQVGIACWLLKRTLGSAGAFAAPLVVILLSVLAMSSVAVLTGNCQRAWMAVIQQRVAMTSNAIAHMKQLKMLGLAMPIETLIQTLRVHELHVGTQFRMVICVAVVVAYAPAMFSPVFAFVFSLGGSYSLGAAQTAEIFTALSFVVLVAMPFVTVLQDLPNMLAALACLGRVQEFLEKDPRDDFRQGAILSETSETSEKKDDSSSSSEPAATIDAARIGWGADKFHMSDVQLAIPAGKLTIVVGPVASGKSTLCKALLGEVPYYQAKAAGGFVLTFNKSILPSGGQRIGYCDQEPFLFNANIRENIVGIVAPGEGEHTHTHTPADEARYREAIKAAMLTADLAQLPQGDRTKVGSNGITLSGGQKQRVSIARALYGGVAAEGLYIFDDVLSGLDADTEEQVFDRVFGPAGLLRNRGGATTILCTHSVRHLPAADHVVALDVQGRIVEQGTFEGLMANRSYIHSLGVTAKKSSASASGSGSNSNSNRESLNEFTESNVDNVDNILPVALPKNTGIFQTTNDPENPAADEEDQKQQRNRALGDATVYRHYFARIGILPLVGFSLFGLGFAFLYNWGTLWIKFWVADAGSGDPSTQRYSTTFYLGMYGLYQVLGLVCLFFVALIAFRTMITMSGAKLHREALQTVVRAPLRFFTTTDNGVITNLFSQDMTLLDGELPQSFANFGIGCFQVLCMAVVIATSSPYLAIVYPFVCVVFWVLQKFYLRTSRQLRLLDLEAKSPLYTHFLDTIKGLATFRAYGWAASPARASISTPDEKPIAREDSVAVAVNDLLVDRSQRPAYLLSMIQRWLTFALNILVAVLATLVVALATLVRIGGSGHAAFTGASLILLMNFGEEIGHIMTSYTKLETSIGAVSRLKSFSENVKSESHDDGQVKTASELPPYWPTGHVKLDNVSASYFDKDEASNNASNNASSKANVLDNVSLDIRAGDKVAICGRTGSGKSSTILLLLRLLNPLEGSSIVIDGISLDKVDRIALRERIIAVPQDAVFLPDGTTFRQNLDPFGGFAASFAPEHTAMCQSVLERVDLWTFVQERGGLDAGMTADTLSQGQKQLFSLGRAIFRRRTSAAAAAHADSGILLLDELSSSVDLTTDRAMQSLIQSEFASYTIIMVSHRLDMVLATCNRVVVLDQGRVVETGEPSELVTTVGTRFHELWELGGGH